MSDQPNSDTSPYKESEYSMEYVFLKIGQS